MILPRRLAPTRGYAARSDARIDLSVRDADRERDCARARRSIVALLAAIGVAAPGADSRSVLLADLEADDRERPPV